MFVFVASTFRFVQHSILRRSDLGTDRSVGHSFGSSILPGIEFHFEDVEFAGIPSTVHPTVPIDEQSATERSFRASIAQKPSIVETRVRAGLSFVHNERLVVRRLGRTILSRVRSMPINRFWLLETDERTSTTFLRMASFNTSLTHRIRIYFLN